MCFDQIHQVPIQFYSNAPDTFPSHVCPLLKKQNPLSLINVSPGVLLMSCFINQHDCLYLFSLVLVCRLFCQMLGQWLPIQVLRASFSTCLPRGDICPPSVRDTFLGNSK